MGFIPITIQTSQWFSSISDQILEKVRLAEEAGDAIKRNEFIATVTDLRILAQLDEFGNGCMIPDLEVEMPYIIVRISR